MCYQSIYEWMNSMIFIIFRITTRSQEKFFFQLFSSVELNYEFFNEFFNDFFYFLTYCMCGVWCRLSDNIQVNAAVQPVIFKSKMILYRRGVQGSLFIITIHDVKITKYHVMHSTIMIDFFYFHIVVSIQCFLFSDLWTN